MAFADRPSADRFLEAKQLGIEVVARGRAGNRATTDALGVAYDVAGRLRRDENDLVQKAVGWLLREAGKADFASLERYLGRHGRAMSRTTVRYAIERAPTRLRRELLECTGRNRS